VVVDSGFIDALQVPLLAGRNFPRQISEADEQSVLITRATAEKLGFTAPQDAVNQLIFTDFGGSRRIIGVVDDIRSAGGMENPTMSPGILETYRPPKTYFLLRLDPAQREAALRHIETVWEKYRPGIPINLRFYETIYEDLVNERTLGISRAALFASVITVLISVLGIQALAYYTGESRTKEVGIRKALGASSISIIALIAWDLLKPVVIAGLIAWDPSDYMINSYYSQFASRIEIPLVLYPAMTLAVLLLVGLSSAVQVLGIASRPPVLALRHE
jgi:putative ABC transport system permease protein